MNQHPLQVSCGQIKYLYDFINHYRDEKIHITVSQLNRIDMNIIVETELSQEESVKYVKELLKSSPMGSALYFTVKS